MLRLYPTCKYSVFGIASSSDPICNLPISNECDHREESVEPYAHAQSSPCTTNPRMEEKNTTTIPVIRLSDLLLSSSKAQEINPQDCPTDVDKRRIQSEHVIRDHLWNALEMHGFVVISVPIHSEPGKILCDLRTCIDQDFFPTQRSETGMLEFSNGSYPEEKELDRNPTTTSRKTESDTRRRPRNVAKLESGLTYINERNVPMYKLGYELCDDIREVYRVHAGAPDSQPWPQPSQPTTVTPRETFLRAMGLCRHICDEALRFTLGYDSKVRLGSGAIGWKRPRRGDTDILSSQRTTWNTCPYYQRKILNERVGDKSVMYAMHYFNDDDSILARRSGKVTGTNIDVINVKEHTDPSLFVLEPFLSDVEGLQVYPCPMLCSYKSATTNRIPSEIQERIPCHGDNVDSAAEGWIMCDGISSPIHHFVKQEDGNMPMILFIGRAFAEKSLELMGRTVVPTLHRVVGPKMASPTSRRTVIYEQKYEEYFPSPTMD